MSQWPFRFIHASDLHLEQPVFGLEEVPSHLEERFLDAPFRAARRLFETALAEQVDFVLFSGDILNPERTGPRGTLFLVEQFQKLAELEISVYWVGGTVDPPESWPASLRLPENVFVFQTGPTEETIYHKHHTPLVRLIGSSRPHPKKPIRSSEYSGDPGGLFSIALAYGNAEAAHLQNRKIDYWALGGQHQRRTLFRTPQVGHYPGATLGRHPLEVGHYGATLVQVDAERQCHLSLLPTAPLQWLQERLTLAPESGANDLQTRLHERMREIRAALPQTDLLITWKIEGDRRLLAELRREPLRTDLLEEMQVEYGMEEPFAWSVALEPLIPETLAPEYYEQQTILGDYLRNIRHLQMNPKEPVLLDAFLGEEHLQSPWGVSLSKVEGAARSKILREAAVLGFDLLSGEETDS